MIFLILQRDTMCSIIQTFQRLSEKLQTDTLDSFVVCGRCSPTCAAFVKPLQVGLYVSWPASPAPSCHTFRSCSAVRRTCSCAPPLLTVSLYGGRHPAAWQEWEDSWAPLHFIIAAPRSSGPDQQPFCFCHSDLFLSIITQSLWP